MKRRAINLLIACSALLCVAAAAMWCRSHLRSDRLIYTFREPSGAWVVREHRFVGPQPTVAKAVEAVSIGSGDGRIVLTHVGFVIPRGQRLLAPGEPEPDYTQDVPYEAAARTGFAFEHPAAARWISTGFPRGGIGFTRCNASWMMSFSYWQAPGWFARGDEYEIPLWFITLLFAIAPVTRIVILLRRRWRFAAGHCPTCGYDLRASPDRCPECGGAISAPVGVARGFQ